MDFEVICNSKKAPTDRLTLTLTHSLNNIGLRDASASIVYWFSVFFFLIADNLRIHQWECDRIVPYHKYRHSAVSTFSNSASTIRPHVSIISTNIKHHHYQCKYFQNLSVSLTIDYYLSRSRQILADLDRSKQISADLSRSRQILADLHRSQ